MSDSPEQPEETRAVDEPDYLVEQYVAGKLTADEAKRLLGRLQDDPGLGQSLLDQLNVDTMLRSLGQAPASCGGQFLPATPGQGSAARAASSGRKTFARVAALAVAACVALVVVAGLWSKRPAGEGSRKDGGREASQVAGIEPTTAAVAVLARSIDANWADPADAHEAGSPLNPGCLRLRSGLAEVEFYSGARVVLEGPGELELRSPSEAFCSAGRLSAEVPPSARGFRIGTPSGAVVDLGTAFGLDVSGVRSEIHVFQGEVELHPESRSMQGLRQGEAASLGADGRLRRFPSDASAFTTATVMDRKATEAQGRRYAAWRASAARWNADPTLVVRLDFEGLGPGDRTLPNRAAAASITGAATIVGCGRADGRWPGKGALEFHGVSDRVRLEVPGEMSSLTFAAWVCVNGLDRRFNSLFMSDAFQPGATHWQILNDGRVRLGVASQGKPGHVDYDSPVIFTPERLGRWVHLAVVFDASRRQVIHYVDGQAVSREPATDVTPLHVGPAEVGNWSPGSRLDRVPIRHYSGRIDEFSVYRRPLDELEIGGITGIGSGANDH